MTRSATDGGNGSRPSQGERLRSAGARATDAYQSVRLAAKRVTEELDEVTPALGVPIELDEEDSLVIVTAEAIAANTK